MVEAKKIIDMSQEEFEELLQGRTLNYLEINGIVLISKSESMDKLKKTAVELLEKFENFLLCKKESQIKLSSPSYA